MLKRIFTFFLQRIPFAKVYELLFAITQLIEKQSKVFFTWHERPQQAEEIVFKNSKTYPDVAIVMQGPLLQDNDFTYQTIKLYKTLFKDALIILSTWEDENAAYLEKIGSLSIVIIRNKKPEYAGYSNINFQIKTSAAGLKEAKKQGVNYAFKTRTDQRIYDYGSFDLFLNLMKVFPLNSSKIQQKRLIVPSLNTFKYRMYGVTDMMMFGGIDDMLLYWNTDFDTRPVDTRTEVSLLEYAKMSVCEIYLCTEFLNKLGEEVKWTFEDSWKKYVDHFCIIDHSMINIYWHKYGRQQEYRHKHYHEHSLQFYSFSDWLNMFYGKAELPDEKILNSRFGDRL